MLAEELVLPVQLQRLTLDTRRVSPSVALVNRLPKLQHLSLCVRFRQQQPLLQLAQLPALQHLALHYTARPVVEAAVATAAAWRLLPQLCELVIEGGRSYYIDGVPTQRSWSAILAGAAAATSLTKLQLDARMRPGYNERADHENYSWDAPPRELAVCGSLTGLTRLKDLAITCDDGGTGKIRVILALGDARALTALTSLTRLHVWRAEHGVGPACIALACQLRQLQHLCLFDCGLQLVTAEGLACLDEIRCLTQLTHLDLRCNALTQQGLKQLTGLPRLQRLRWMEDDVDEEVHSWY
uniref:Uncharacterized protein n=1 Tax=Tetradesmus obliquus TaxID=3088 RepID=A0A383VKZ4_TETOB|eukprot:jgi/Sobl393_1/4213/SZX65603.1